MPLTELARRFALLAALLLATPMRPAHAQSGDSAWAVSTSVTQGTFQSKPIDRVGVELMVLSPMPAGWVIRSIHWSSRRK